LKSINVIHHIKRLKEKNHIYLYRKATSQNPNSIHDLKKKINLGKSGIEGNFLNLTKHIYKNPTSYFAFLFVSPTPHTHIPGAESFKGLFLANVT
jgi:hypothetical protein